MKTKLFTLMAICLTFSLFVSNVSATSRFVKTTAAGTADGSSWENASANIQAMIEASASGDTVQIAAGKYLIAATLLGKDGVSLFGGYPANATTGALRDLSTNQTVLDGQAARRIFTSPIDIVLTPITPQRLNGLTFQRGYSNEGSAISLYNGVIVQNCKIWNNISDGTKGAAIYISGSSIPAQPTNFASGAVINCLIINNTSSAVDGGSGGIYANPATYFGVFNCIIANNDCNDPAGSGGLKHAAASSAIFNNIFFGNLNLALSGTKTVLNNYRGYRDETGLNGSSTNWFDNDVVPFLPKAASNVNKCRTDFASPGFILPTTFVGYDDTKMAEIEASNWRVPETSGCVGYGTKGGTGNPITITFASITTDLVGNPRLSGTLPDLGCYEFQLSTGISTVIEKGLAVVKGRTIGLLQSASSITVFDARGAMVQTQNNVSSGAIISVNHSGIYLVRAKTEQGVKTQKLIVR